MLRRYQYRHSLCALRCTAVSLALLGAVPAFAQQAAPATPPSDSAMVNLVRLLIEQGVLTPEKGAVLMAQAQTEATQARAATASPNTTQQASNDLPPPPAGTVRVPYVPETVRAQIKDELRNEVLAQAKSEGWASPAKAAPGWVNNIRFTGDLRLRSQTQLYSKSNSNQIIDADEFNATGPIDVAANNSLFPTLNTLRNRYNLVQLRARFGAEATIANRFQLGVQLATGDDSGPVSTNALLGGGFRKRDIWLDRAYVKASLFKDTSVIAGRFENPFLHTDLVFDPDLSFDGITGEVNVGKLIGSDYNFTLRGGAFPLDFGDVDLPSTSFDKRNFRDRYLLSGQIEVGRRFDSGIEAHLSAAYHDYTYLRGHVSQPCDIYSNPAIFCSTDAYKPFSLSKGNTLMFLRRFDTTNNPNPGSPSEPQLFGLKFAYRVVDVNGSVTVPIADGIRATLTGNYVRNLGFDPKNICRDGVAGQPQNNVSANTSQLGICDPSNLGTFDGGNQGYAGYLSIGYPSLFNANPRRAERGQWAINGGYKYLESDAVLDSFTDSDFHLGGTNTKGYFIGGNYALFDNVTIGGRWLSANEIVDQPLSIDVLQIDFGVAF